MVSKIIQNMSVSQTFQSLQIWRWSHYISNQFRTNFEPEIDTSEHFRQHVQNARGFAGIAGFTDQRTAFTRAQSAILQGRDFNLRVERARKILIHEANISKTDPVTLPF